MTDQENPSQQQENKLSDKELNFRALESRYQRQLDHERARIAEMEKMLQERNSHHAQDDDDDDEPYVAPKKLEKKLARFEERTHKKTQEEIDRAVKMALFEEKKNSWLDNNKDFHEIMNEQNAARLYEHDPELAQSLLSIPNEFEKQKAVYKNIKALGLHKPKSREPSIQEKIDANRRSPYYQPSQSGIPPYSSQGDFSQAGQKQAYQKMQELKSKYGM